MDVMRKRTLLMLLLLFASNDIVFAGTKCFIAKEGDKIVAIEGDCSQRVSPCSTFKISLSLIGHNEHIFISEAHPQWPYKTEYSATREVCQKPISPATWMQNSCVWYSQVLTQKLGMAKFKDYMAKFNYGNQDLTGDPGKNDGIARAWLTSSLAISPKEQIVFLAKLIAAKHPVSEKAQFQTKELIYLEELPHSWKLFGKTGTGEPLQADGTRKADRQIGWFVGWLEKGERKIIFAHLIEDEGKDDTPAGPRAKAVAKDKLLALINK
jgi:beta-lactamase class D